MKRIVSLAEAVARSNLVFRSKVCRGWTIERAFAVDSWWAASQTAAMVASTWVLYSWFATDLDRRRLGFVIGDNGRPLQSLAESRLCLGKLAPALTP